MPSVSEKQKRFFGLIVGLKRGQVDKSKVDAKTLKAAKSISLSSAADFASHVKGEKARGARLKMLRKGHK
jgi:hypothetical protein